MSFVHLQAAAERLLNGKPEDLGFNLNYLKAALEVSQSDQFKDEVREEIERAWRTRAKFQDHGKPKSAKYQKAELEFFCGAIQALQQMLPDKGDAGLTSFVPPAWVFLPMSGRNIVEVE